MTVPPTDPVREAKERDVDDPAHTRADPEELRQGGPTRTPGMATTTGGRAGPAMRPGPGRPQTGRGKVAPTTTGDAGSGGMHTPAEGTTRDATTGGSTAAESEDEPDR